jgi:hypothetical protein
MQKWNVYEIILDNYITTFRNDILKSLIYNKRADIFSKLQINNKNEEIAAYR